MKRWFLAKSRRACSARTNPTQERAQIGAFGSSFRRRHGVFSLAGVVLERHILSNPPRPSVPLAPYWRGFLLVRTMADPARLALFIDYQNVYKRAREAFGLDAEPHFVGQINPLKVGRLIAARSKEPARLSSVHVYRGEPNGHHDPRAYAACRRQAEAWRRLDPCVCVETRPLRYPRDFPTSPAREKGIDVKIAIDYVHAAVSKSADIVVMFSGDTDLIPAVEMVFGRFSSLRVIASSAAWVGAPAVRLNLPGFWCHRLNRRDFESVRDDADYLSPSKR